MGVMKLLYTLRGEGTTSLGLAAACRHRGIVVMDIVRFDKAGRPGFDAARDAYWPALLAWREEQREAEEKT